MSTVDPGAAARLFVALDLPTGKEAVAMARAVGPEFSYKIGLELFTAAGPALLAEIRGARLFLDLKLHDIPETVARAVGAAAAHGVDFLTIHALGGRRMLEAAAGGAAESGRSLRLLAVTVLTSHDDAELEELGLPAGAGLAVNLASLASRCGIAGFVCSPLEVEALRRAVGPESFIVTPGIRPGSGAARPDDQRRVATPAAAIAAGASALVVGRPVRDAPDPRAAALAIAAEIAG